MALTIFPVTENFVAEIGDVDLCAPTDAQMAEIVRQDCPWIIRSDNLDFVLWQRWARNFKYHPLAMGLEKYQRVDEADLAGTVSGKGARP